MKPAWTKSNKAEKGYYSAKHVLNDILVCGRFFLLERKDRHGRSNCGKRVSFANIMCRGSNYSYLTIPVDLVFTGFLLFTTV